MLEDMLWSCVTDFGARWDQYLALAEFDYNNSYHSSIQMAPFEVVYGQSCRSPIGYFDSVVVESIDTYMLPEDLEWMQLIHCRLVTA